MVTGTAGARTADAADLFLDLLKNVLTRAFLDEEVRPVDPEAGWRRLLVAPLQRAARSQGMELVRRRPVDHARRSAGLDWPPDAETMIGLRRLESLQQLIRTVIDERVPGDILEAGVWRGGASIFARAALEAYGDGERVVWLADSFRGLPRPSLEEDAGDEHWKHDVLAVPLEQVKRNFERYGLLDERVRFLVGWFGETLPAAPIDRLAILRLDGDMYESTMDGLVLYDKVSPRGFVIIDDFGSVPACARAVEDFRERHAIGAPLRRIDDGSVYWRKDGAPS